MERLYELPPRIIHELDEELPVGVLGLDNWGYIMLRTGLADLERASMS